MIRLLLVDSSNSFLKSLEEIFKSENEIEVSGIARSGKEAIVLFNHLKPDVVIIDLILPGITGADVINEIAKNADIRRHNIIILTSTGFSKEMQNSIRENTQNRIRMVEKPLSFSNNDIIKMKKSIFSLIYNFNDLDSFDLSATIRKKPIVLPKTKTSLIAMGGSIGSTNAIMKILKSFPVNTLFPPILFVIHIREGFLKHYIKTLENELILKVKEIENNEVLQPGIIYFAPDNKNLEIIENESEMTSRVYSPKGSGKIVPSIDFTFMSLAKLNKKIAAGILTGMGNDGAQGLLEIKRKDNFTFIEKYDDCTATGMPSSAVNLGAVDEVFSLDEIAKKLIRMASRVDKNWRLS